MKIGISVHDSKIAVALDFAPAVNIYELDGGRIGLEKTLRFENEILPVRAAMLADEGVGKLICGAVSGALAGMLSYSGIEVISGVTGNLDEVLEAFMNGNLTTRNFAMPGCGMRRRQGQCGRGRGRRRRR